MPAKGRQFVMKGMMQKEEPPIEEPHREGPKIKTDAEGEDRAYTQGDTYTEDNKLYVAGSHTPTDWFDDVTKIPLWGDLRQSHRYKAGRAALLSNNKINWAGGHSLGGSVVLQLQKDFPDRLKKTVTWGAPVMDLLGTQKAEVGQENVDRKSNRGDLVSIFDNSAKKTDHPNPFSYAPSFWHDFHNMDQASGTLGGEAIGEKQEEATDQFTPFSLDEPDDTKMTAMTK